MLFQFNCLRSLSVFVLMLLCVSSTKGVTVSGRMTESDAAPVSGITITVELIGGELPPITTQTGADGDWSVSNPLLTGNIRVTPSSSSFTFSPASRDTFTFADLTKQDFTAAPTVPRANISVLTGGGVPIFNGGSHTFPGISLRATSGPTFLIRNDGTLPLGKISITVTGAPQGEFSVERAPATTLEPNQITIATIRVIPATTGLRAATVLIRSDDPNESPFVVQLSGLVVSLEVTNTANSGSGSLRETIHNTEITEDHDIIHFHPSLSGQTIVVSSEIPISASGSVVIDATSLPEGITLSGGGGSRIFKAGRNTLNLLGLTFTSGNSTSASSESSGGAILSEGILLVSACTFTNNLSPSKGGAIACLDRFSSLSLSNCTFLCNTGLLGGAVASDTETLITQSTFACNSGNFGGALGVEGKTTISRSTMTGNQGNAGGAIAYASRLTLTHCTISGNIAGSGAGLFSPVRGTVTCKFSIVAGNQAIELPNVFGILISDSSLTEGFPLLAPLDNYGGLTKTMALLPGSPARDGATNSASTTDQRGFPIVSARDIGAYEAGADSNFNAFIWEHLPAGTTAAEHDPAIDFDGDGADNFAEWLALTDPADPSSAFRILRIVPTLPNSLEVTFTSSLGRHYHVETSSNLIDWVPEPAILEGSERSMTVQVLFGDDKSRRFIRILASL